jgi:hypothetical protein
MSTEFRSVHKTCSIFRSLETSALGGSSMLDITAEFDDGFGGIP